MSAAQTKSARRRLKFRNRGRRRVKETAAALLKKKKGK